jgi:hypothetical protein
LKTALKMSEGTGYMNDALASDASPSATSPKAHDCEPCPGCRRPLPIRAKLPGEVAAHWECAACRAPFTGILVQEEAARVTDAVRIGQLHFDTAGVPPVPTALRQLVREFAAARRENDIPDKRAAGARMPVQFDVTILPVDENWTPYGKPLVGLAIDLTAQGLGMVTSAPVESRHIAIQIRHATAVLQLLGEVVWTHELETSFYHTGIHFLLRFGRSPLRSDAM